MNIRLLSAILLLITSSFSSKTESVNIFGVDFVLSENRKLSFKNESNSVRVVEIVEMRKNTMSFSNISWKNRMNGGSEDKIFLTNENSEIRIVVSAEYANDKEINFTYKLREQLDD
ncbi:MAG: hypothetical protein V4670_02860 [Bacteroidota bacterium]